MPSRTRILLVEDHELVRSGLRATLADKPDLELVGECTTGAEAKATLQRIPCDVLLCDISLPDISGIEILAHVRSHHPSVAVLMLSAHPEKQFGVNALKAGAAGFIGKGASDDELLRAIRTVGRGQRYVGQELAGLLVDGMDSGDQPQHTVLSQREFTIFRRLATGESVTEIAKALTLSVKTVSTYRSRIMEKMAMKTNADLTAYCLKHGLMQ